MEKPPKPDAEKQTQDSQAQDGQEKNVQAKNVQQVQPDKGVLRHFRAYIESLKSNRKTQIITAIILLVLIGGYFGISKLLHKPKGGFKYGLCKIFLEQYYDYPSSARVLAAKEGISSAALYFSIRNAFGDQALHLSDCVYGRKENGRDNGALYMKEVKIDGFPVDRETVEKFSNSMKYLRNAPMDLTLPTGFSLELKTYKNRKTVPLDGVYGF